MSFIDGSQLDRSRSLGTHTPCTVYHTGHNLDHEIVRLCPNRNIGIVGRWGPHEEVGSVSRHRDKVWAEVE